MNANLQIVESRTQGGKFRQKIRNYDNPVRNNSYVTNKMIYHRTPRAKVLINQLSMKNCHLYLRTGKKI